MLTNQEINYLLLCNLIINIFYRSDCGVKNCYPSFGAFPSDCDVVTCAAYLKEECLDQTALTSFQCAFGFFERHPECECV